MESAGLGNGSTGGLDTNNTNNTDIENVSVVLEASSLDEKDKKIKNKKSNSNSSGDGKKEKEKEKDSDQETDQDESETENENEEDEDEEKDDGAAINAKQDAETTKTERASEGKESGGSNGSSGSNSNSAHIIVGESSDSDIDRDSDSGNSILHSGHSYGDSPPTEASFGSSAHRSSYQLFLALCEWSSSGIVDASAVARSGYSPSDSQKAQARVREYVNYVNYPRVRYVGVIFRAMAIPLFCCCYVPYLLVHKEALVFFHHAP